MAKTKSAAIKMDPMRVTLADIQTGVGLINNKKFIHFQRINTALFVK